MAIASFQSIPTHSFSREKGIKSTACNYNTVAMPLTIALWNVTVACHVQLPVFPRKCKTHSQSINFISPLLSRSSCLNFFLVNQPKYSHGSCWPTIPFIAVINLQPCSKYLGNGKQSCQYKIFCCFQLKIPAEVTACSRRTGAVRKLFHEGYHASIQVMQIGKTTTTCI